MEAILFTASGDMRQAINNLQSTHAGFGTVNAENVFKVCDQPHPAIVNHMLASCKAGQFRQAHKLMIEELWDKVWKIFNIASNFSQGYSPLDILNTMFKVTKNSDLPEYLKLEFMKARLDLVFPVLTRLGNRLCSQTSVRRLWLFDAIVGAFGNPLWQEVNKSLSYT